MKNYREIVEKQREFFNTNDTKSFEFRMEQLEKLEAALDKYGKNMAEALAMDLNKPDVEVHLLEVGFVVNYLNYIKMNLEDWMETRTEDSSHAFPGSTSTIYAEPYGVMLVMAPFNYPVMLTIAPLIDAIMTGNTAIIKPSELCPNISSAIAQMISEIFPENYVTVIEGDVETNEALLKERFDYIFFTGSPRVGKIVMEAASKHLTPVILELGGKSPSIVSSDANLYEAVKKILWSKMINAGQTCIATDYVMVEESVKDDFVQELVKALKEFYGENPIDSKDLCQIVTKRHTERLEKLLADTKGTVVAGGTVKTSDRLIEPTIVTDVTWEDSLMQEEIFGPILPVLSFKKENLEEEVIKPIKNGEKPLALYLFTEESAIQKQILSEISFGGGAINVTMAHALNLDLPFGGVGNSGLGHYHGKNSFDQFTHKKSVITLPAEFPFDGMYPPYSQEKLEALQNQ